ncbi:MAG: radical SAM protein [Flavobacteriia bacterium]|nr:radical SAM protein [Flavobacteriia bacterium]
MEENINQDKSKTANNKNFCPAPWVSVYLAPDGTIDNCCVSRNNLGNIKHSQDTHKILSGNINLGVQQAMLDNQVVPGCAWCHGTVDNLQDSLIRDHGDLGDSFYQPGFFNLKYLDARWSNTCNLACVYCNEGCSSLWAQENNRHIPIKTNDRNNFLQYVLDNVESLERIQMAGGEPLLLKENELLINEIISRNPKCHITINTNLINIDNKIYQQLIRLDNVRWLVSFEATGAQYEYIRYPGKWSVFENNLQQLKLDVENTQSTISFNMVFLSLNAMSYWDTIDWTLDFFSDTQKSATLALALYNNGVFPGAFDPRALSANYRNQIINRMQKGNYSGLRGYQNIAKSLASNEHISVKFNDTMQGLDSRRGLNSRQLFPEIYNSIENTL